MTGLGAAQTRIAKRRGVYSGPLRYMEKPGPSWPKWASLRAQNLSCFVYGWYPSPVKKSPPKEQLDVFSMCEIPFTKMKSLLPSNPLPEKLSALSTQ